MVPNLEFTSLDLKTLGQQIHKLIEIYRNGRPGFSDAAPNHKLHSAIEDFDRGCYYPNDPELGTWMLEIKTDLEYRLDVVAKSDKYVELLELPRPDDLRCHDWDVSDCGPGHRPRREEEKRWRSLFEGFGGHLEQLLFPIPVGRPGWDTYDKGFMYIRHVVYLSGLSPEEIKSKSLGLLARLVKEEPGFRDEMKRVIIKLKREDQDEYDSDEKDTVTSFYTMTGAAPEIVGLLDGK